MGLIDLTKRSKKTDELQNSDAAPADAAGEKTTVAESKPAHAPKTVADLTGAGRPAADESGDELGKLREIVFGPQISAFREELARIENRHALEMSRLREEMLQSSRRIEDRVTELDARATKADHDIRSQLDSRSDVLAETIRENGHKAFAALDEALKELRESKIDRATLSSFLVDLAGQVEGSPIKAKR